MKTLITDIGSTTGLIESSVYKQGDKENGYKYYRRPGQVLIYVDEYNAEGLPTGKATKVYLNADHILKIAEQINAIALMEVDKAEITLYDDDLPW